MTIYFDSDKNAYGYEIRNPIATTTDELWSEVHADLDAWDIKDGKFVDLRNSAAYKAKQLVLIKERKNEENTEACHIKLSSGVFTIRVGSYKIKYVFDDNTKNDLSAAALGFITGRITEKEWTDEDGKTVMLTQDHVAEMLLTLEAFGNPIWARWGLYKKQIEACKTKEEVEAIVIDYTDNGEEE